ncbi:MAG TPA: hypothetical protein VLA99_03040 [Nitrospiraceae bacterium]|nr:hypothetical protein [Nitrospiraceae bacterium]
MQTLDIHRPGMPDLQFALLVTALCTSRLPDLNIPEALRTRIFDRCWVLLHDSPPPRKPELRVLDLRPWTEVTLDAMIETIRSVLTEAGITTLVWDHPPSEPTRISTPEAQPLIDRFEQLYPRPSRASGAAGRDPMQAAPDRLHGHGPDIRQVIGELAALMAAVPTALKRGAADIAASGKDAEVADMVRKGAEVMRDSGALYLTWARHYAALAEGDSEAAEAADETEFGV